MLLVEGAKSGVPRANMSQCIWNMPGFAFTRAASTSTLTAIMLCSARMKLDHASAKAASIPMLSGVMGSTQILWWEVFGCLAYWRCSPRRRAMFSPAGLISLETA
jgi:hypothetical protein